MQKTLLIELVLKIKFTEKDLVSDSFLGTF